MPLTIHSICISKSESERANSNVNVELYGGIIKEKILIGFLAWVNVMDNATVLGFRASGKEQILVGEKKSNNYILNMFNIIYLWDFQVEELIEAFR